MKFAMCNEFCDGWPLEDALKLARDTGYHGVEVAPYTLADDVRDIPMSRRDKLRSAAEAAGVQIIGLHWLLVKPVGLYVNGPDAELRKKTRDYFSALIDFCADLGGDRMVIGSPKSRNVVPELTYAQAFEYARETFSSLMEQAAERGVKLCIEPLSPAETNFITTVKEGVALCKAVNHPNFRLHLDVKAMCGEGEGRPLDDIILDGKDFAAHLHVNDANRNGPGWGDTDYAPIKRGLAAIGYDDYASVEVFDFSFGAETIARKSIEFLKTV
ncbi:MAG: sugar phosphate isomerase/epimerase, partial [Victivallales bacterium]|nr:sugar phosphate isomerase/epimerase [Victivallales bacterium]